MQKCWLWQMDNLSIGNTDRLRSIHTHKFAISTVNKRKKKNQNQQQKTKVCRQCPSFCKTSRRRRYFCRFLMYTNIYVWFGFCVCVCATVCCVIFMVAFRPKHCFVFTLICVHFAFRIHLESSFAQKEFSRAIESTMQQCNV